MMWTLDRASTYTKRGKDPHKKSEIELYKREKIIKFASRYD